MDSKQVKYRHDEWYAVCKHCAKEFISGAATQHEAEFDGSKKGVRVFTPDHQTHMYCSTKCHENACKPARGKPKWMPIPPLPDLSRDYVYKHFAPRGIVKLGDGWAAFCCGCGKEMTRGHDSEGDAFNDLKVACWAWPEDSTGKYKDIITYCSATCKTAGEKRRKNMKEEEGKVMYRVVDKDTGSIKDGHGTNEAAVADTWIGAIRMIHSLQGLTGNRLDVAWQDCFERDYRVESFTLEPMVEIDWIKVTEKCVDQDSWGSTSKCALCIAVGHEKAPTAEGCCKCAAHKFAESKGWNISDVRGCECLLREKANAMGVYEGLSSAHIVLPCLSDLRIWIKNGGMDKK